MGPLDTPVALIVFSRASTTRRVIDALRTVRPTVVFVIADGPRSDKPDDARLCAEARAVVDEIDWPCDVRRRFLDLNLGCGHSPAEGLDWVFSQVEECIILEDDCVPDPSFFRYCTELLDRYRMDSRVMMVSGNNHLLKRRYLSTSYTFAINTQTWGWATWRRAWSEYDFYMSDWPRVRSLDWLAYHLGSNSYAKWWLKLFDMAFHEAESNPRCTYWDFQWTYACWKNHGLTIIPRENLVSNIGWGNGATHTLSESHWLANIPVEPMTFPLVHPDAMIPDHEADEILKETVYGFRPLYKRVFPKLRRVVRSIFRPAHVNTKAQQ